MQTGSSGAQLSPVTQPCYSACQKVTSAVSEGCCFPETLSVVKKRPPLPCCPQLRVTHRTSAGEMVRLVVQEMNEVSRRMLGSPERCVYREEQLEHFGLVLLLEDREKWLQDDFRPLELQNPWLRGKLCVRVKEYSPLALQCSRATTV